MHAIGSSPASGRPALHETNIRLDSVITDIAGVSGRRMIEAMIHLRRRCFDAYRNLPLLKDGTGHPDLGASHFDCRSTAIRARRLVAAERQARLGGRRPAPGRRRSMTQR